jgi:hypothetical protein
MAPTRSTAAVSSLVLVTLASPLLTAAWPLYTSATTDDQQGRQQEAETTPPAPIVFIPGKGGSQLEVKVDADHQGDCASTDDWTRVWINIYDFLPFYGELCVCVVM